MDGVQLPQGYRHFEEAVYFLPFSSQKFQSKWSKSLLRQPPPNKKVSLAKFPFPLMLFGKTLQGTSSLCILSSILNCKSSNQGIELQFKGSFYWITNCSCIWRILVQIPVGAWLCFRSILNRLYLPNLRTKLMATCKSRMPKQSDSHLVKVAVPVIMAQSLLWGSQIIDKKADRLCMRFSSTCNFGAGALTSISKSTLLSFAVPSLSKNISIFGWGSKMTNMILSIPT